MQRQLESADLAAHVDPVGIVREIIHPGVLFIEGPVNALRFELLVGVPDFFHIENRQHDTLRVAQGEMTAGLQPGCHLGRDVQGDGNAPQGPIRQAHRVAHRPVVLTFHEPLEG